MALRLARPSMVDEMRECTAAQLAADEGLSLVPSSLTGTGYEGVVLLPQSESKPDQEGCRHTSGMLAKSAA